MWLSDVVANASKGCFMGNMDDVLHYKCISGQYQIHDRTVTLKLERIEATLNCRSTTSSVVVNCLLRLSSELSRFCLSTRRRFVDLVPSAVYM